MTLPCVSGEAACNGLPGMGWRGLLDTLAPGPSWCHGGPPPPPAPPGDRRSCSLFPPSTPWPCPHLPVPWGLTGGALSHHGSLQCVPLALQWRQGAELVTAVKEQVEVIKVLRTGGTGGSHACGGKAPQSGHGTDSSPHPLLVQLLRNKLQHLQERWECLRDPTAL